jgi:hypothetical protein
MIAVRVIRSGVGPVQMARDGIETDFGWFEGTIQDGATVEVDDGSFLYWGFRSGRRGTWIFEDGNVQA